MNKAYRLDNAAQLFAAVSEKSNTSVFRISVVLKEEIDGQILQSALDRVIKRFPLLGAELKKGPFSGFLRPLTSRICVREESEYPCAPMDRKTDDGVLRVVYYQKRISVEIFHAATDGFGGMEFLKSLLYEYLRLSGREVRPDGRILTADSPVEDCELEDSFARYYNRAVPPLKSKINRAYRIQGSAFLHDGNRLIQGVYEADALLDHARSLGVTLTQYFSAVFLYALMLEYGRTAAEPFVLSVPVNLRQIFPSRSLKNFFSIVNVGAEAGGEFADLLTQIKRQFQEKVKLETLQASIAENCRVLSHPLVRCAPLFLRNAGTKFVFAKWGENCKTASLSNLGAARLPQSMLPFVERMDAVLYPTPKSPVNCGICTAAGKLTVTFTTTIRESGAIRRFFTLVAEQTGCTAEIFSNEWS